MHLSLLNPTQLTPSVLIEGYSSLIWTERWQAAGEFELKTPRIKELMPYLVEGNFLGLTESQEPMIIESRNIQDSGHGPELIVTGRSMFSFMEQRTPMDNQVITMDNQGHTVPTRKAVSEFEVRQRIGAFFVTKGIGGLNEMTYAYPVQWPPAQYLPAQAADKLPISIYTATGEYYGGYDYVYTGEARGYVPYTKFGNYYDHIVDVLKPHNLGVVFDNQPLDGYLYVIIKTAGDKTPGNTAGNKPVIFDQHAGHLSDVSWMWSNADYKNIAYVYTDVFTSQYNFKIVPAPGVSASISGLNRRVLQVDATDIDYENDPSVSPDPDLVMTSRGLSALAEHNKTIAIDAKVSPTAPYTFGYSVADDFSDYSMGDLVTLQTDYGVKQTMQVTEYIRSEDSEGNYAAYPTLTAVV